MCDTFLALPSVTSDGSIIFGKNSDREPNEAQALEYYPAQEYELPVNVQCTYRSIPQVRETYATFNFTRCYGEWFYTTFSASRQRCDRSRELLDECRELTREAFRQARRKTEEWITLVQSLPLARRNKWVYRHYWQRQNARVAITVK